MFVIDVIEVISDAKKRRRMTTVERELFELIAKMAGPSNNRPSLILNLQHFFRDRRSPRFFDINCSDTDGLSPLMRASWAIDECIMGTASEDDINHQKQVIELLLENGADINLQNDAPNVFLGTTALHCACNSENAEIVTLLLQRGASPHLADAAGTTPLMYATDCLHHGMMKALLDCGVDVNVRSNFGESAFHRLVYYFGQGNLRPLVEMLLAHGADINLQDEDGATPLFLAVFHYGGYELSLAGIRLLLDAHANVNIPVTREVENMNGIVIPGDTPLHAAVLIHDVKVVMLLLEYHPNLYIRNSANETALDRAKRLQHDQNLDDAKKLQYENIVNVIQHEQYQQLYKYLTNIWLPKEQPTSLMDVTK